MIFKEPIKIKKNMSIGYNTQKKWVFVYGYWVLYPKKVGIWVWVLGIIPKKSGYLGMGIGYDTHIIPNTQKKTGYGCMFKINNNL
jgi:hypothetical protein